MLVEDSLVIQEFNDREAKFRHRLLAGLFSKPISLQALFDGGLPHG